MIKNPCANDQVAEVENKKIERQLKRIKEEKQWLNTHTKT